MRGVQAFIQQPPRGRQRCHRAVLHLLINQRTDTGHAIGAVGHIFQLAGVSVADGGIRW